MYFESPATLTKSDPSEVGITRPKKSETNDIRKTEIVLVLYPFCESMELHQYDSINGSESMSSAPAKSHHKLADVIFAKY